MIPSKIGLLVEWLTGLLIGSHLIGKFDKLLK